MATLDEVKTIRGDLSSKRAIIILNIISLYSADNYKPHKAFWITNKER